MFLYQPIDGYCYNSDTHFLFNFICQNLKQFKNIQGDLLDIGSGSGVLGLLIARDYKNIILNQVEIQKEFCFLSQKNSQINNIKSKLFEGNFLNIQFKTQYKYIVSNPPFYPDCVVKSDNKNIQISRYNNNLPLDKFICKVSQILIKNGIFFFCYDVSLLNDIIICCNRYQLNIEVIQFLHSKENKNASLVMIMARNNSKSMTKILPPVIMFDKTNKLNENVIDIYNNCSTYSMKCKVNDF
ncbi:tRNA (adenine37-N(6))-methyltransferase TrmN6 [hydrothermal vent metagenome]|uniref:tRNA (Adenine37-N(6))-methyltransferase TrmN6 n=1 Tax=hydrothermal vent metagenome TaxID=652676 RepID=A0A3B1E931_9ZZZZ